MTAQRNVPATSGEVAIAGEPGSHRGDLQVEVAIEAKEPGLKWLSTFVANAIYLIA